MESMGIFGEGGGWGGEREEKGVGRGLCFFCVFVFVTVGSEELMCDPVFVGNIVIIGVLVAAYVGYSAYRQKNQGGGITGGVKRS